MLCLRCRCSLPQIKYIASVAIFSIICHELRLCIFCWVCLSTVIKINTNVWYKYWDKFKGNNRILSLYITYIIFSSVHSHRPLVINIRYFQKVEGSINKNNIRFDTTYLSKRTLQQNCCIQYQTKQCFSKLNLIQSKSDSRNCKMRKIRVLRNIIIHDSVREMTSYLAL